MAGTYLNLIKDSFLVLIYSSLPSCFSAFALPIECTLSAFQQKGIFSSSLRWLLFFINYSFAKFGFCLLSNLYLIKCLFNINFLWNYLRLYSRF